MILKFDHIARACRTDEEKTVIDSYEDYDKVFTERRIHNSLIKEHLMYDMQEKHDICLLNKSGFLPIEITAYDHVVDNPEHYTVIEDNLIISRSISTDESASFYSAIGFVKKQNNNMELRTAIDNEPIRIRIIETKNTNTIYGKTLDNRGYCCLAFLVNHIEKEASKLEEKGIILTKTDELILHDRKMKVLFAYSAVGDICELIQVYK